FLDERAVRIELGEAARVASVYEPPRLDGELDRVVMKAELGCDGADLPVLGEKHPPDSRALLIGDHRATSEMTSRSRSRKLPSPSRRGRRRRGAPAGTQTTL